MKPALHVSVVTLVASLFGSAAVMAHHSFAMSDRTIEKVVTGTVVRWQFNSPHSWLYVNVKNASGPGETLWSFEGSAPPQLLQRGVTGSSFEPGATVTLSYCPMKDGRPGGGLGWVRLPNGTFLNPADGGCDGSDRAVEKWKAWMAAGFTSSADAQKPK